MTKNTGFGSKGCVFRIKKRGFLYSKLININIINKEREKEIRIKILKQTIGDFGNESRGVCFRSSVVRRVVLGLKILHAIYSNFSCEKTSTHLIKYIKKCIVLFLCVTVCGECGEFWPMKMNVLLHFIMLTPPTNT